MVRRTTILDISVKCEYCGKVFKENSQKSVLTKLNIHLKYIHKDMNKVNEIKLAGHNHNSNMDFLEEVHSYNNLGSRGSR